LFMQHEKCNGGFTGHAIGHTGWVSSRGYRTIAAAIIVVAVAVSGLYWMHTRNESAATGTGLTYNGTFYWASGAEVRTDALGPTTAQGVAFQDTKTTLREIQGLDPNVTMAAWLPMISSQVPHAAWILISTDQSRGTNPAAYPDTRAVLTKP
jgi:hypothetical protein